MDKIEQLQKAGREIVRFMRGKYLLDEVGNGKDELKFRRSGKTVLTIYIRPDRYDLMLIFGKAEREKFEEQRNTFSSVIQSIYDSSKTYYDGKWMMFPVENAEMFDEVKKLIQIKKNPYRKPLPKTNPIYSKCGHRCDLCVHFKDLDNTLRKEIRERLTRVYGPWSWDDDGCPGCVYKTDVEGNSCEAIKCAACKGIDKCLSCGEYPCSIAPVGYKSIEPKSIFADDVTWGILPYVEDQYGN
jgi:hypothetical protein